MKLNRPSRKNAARFNPYAAWCGRARRPKYVWMSGAGTETATNPTLNTTSSVMLAFRCGRRIRVRSAARLRLRSPFAYTHGMPNIDKYPRGSFCWIELGTTDQSAAKTFYGALFGWTPNDMPMGPDDLYTIFRIEGRDAAAGYTLRAEQRAQ